MSLAFINAIEAAEPHGDAVWDIKWTTADTVLSASADGSVRQWDVASGQTSAARPPHKLAITSLSALSDGSRVLYNSLEGTTSLWDVQEDALVGTHKSFDRSVPGAEACKCRFGHPASHTYSRI